jgi:hypothetical protein
MAPPYRCSPSATRRYHLQRAVRIPHLSGMSIGSYKDINYLKRLRPCQAQPYPLFSEDFFHLADFLLDFPAYLFANTFGF